MTDNKKINISESLGRLEEIVNWFENQKDVDVGEGLKRVKEGAAIIKDLKTRLKEVETEFNEIKQELEE